MGSEEHEGSVSENRWYALACIVPTLITSTLEHYRWQTERRDKERKRAFNKRFSKALDKALAEDRAKRDAAKPPEGA